MYRIKAIACIHTIVTTQGNGVVAFVYCDPPAEF